MNSKRINATTQAALRAVSPAVAIVLILLGLAALAGWPCLRTSAACNFLLLGVAVLALRHYPGAIAQRIALAIGVVLVGISVFSRPSDMAAETAWAFAFFGLSLFFLSRPSEKNFRIGQGLLLAAVSIGVYQGMLFYFEVRTADFAHAQVAIGTAGAGLLTGIALFGVYPDRGVIGILHRQTAGGLLARRFLPWGLLTPLLMWWIRNLTQQQQLLSEEQGFALFFTLTFAFLTALITNTALRLHAMDIQQAETTALFDSVIENIPNMIFLKDARDLRFRLFNRAGEALLGYPRGDLLGKNDYDFFPKDQADFFTQKDREILQQRDPVDIPEEPINTKSGQRILHTKKITVQNELGQPRYLLGISEDITQRKQHESQLEEQRKMLIQTSKMSALGEMASGIAHEINNPLSVVYGEAEDLRELATLEKLNFDEIARIALKIEATTERIARIIKGLRTFARDSSEEPFLAVNLREVMEDTLVFCRERFLTQGTELTVMPIPNTLEIECRRIQLSQVLLNLLNNAFDALQGRDHRQIRVEWKEMGNELEILVGDNGPGIPEAIRDKIFQPFFSTKEVGKGTGLGLSIAKGIVEAHQGTLTVENAPGGGAVFKLHLPRQQRPAETAAA